MPHEALISVNLGRGNTCNPRSLPFSFGKMSFACLHPTRASPALFLLLFLLPSVQSFCLFRILSPARRYEKNLCFLFPLSCLIFLGLWKRTHSVPCASRLFPY